MTERMGKFFNISITVKNTEGEQKNVNTELLGLNKSRNMFVFKYEVRPGINTVEVTERVGEGILLGNTSGESYGPTI